jgi:hypothetical protein
MTEKVTTVQVQDKYLDPANTPDIIAKLGTLRILGEVKSLVDEVFPDWIVTTMNYYCADYPHITSNWKKICEMADTKPTQVLIVEELAEDNAHSLIITFAECFTRAGFSVRRKREYFPCEKCGCAIPNSGLWQHFKEKGFKVPEKWNVTCVACQ